jgi:predicted nucleotidyltransferase
MAGDWYNREMADALQTVSKKLNIPDLLPMIQSFCSKWKIVEFAFFGSVLRDDFNDESDVDILIRLSSGIRIGFFELADMEDELAAALGRKVEIFTRKGLEFSRNPERKASILSSAKVVYAAA